MSDPTQPDPNKVDQTQIETKLAAARTRLILEKPFLGALVMHLDLKPGEPSWCRTTGTDARFFYYNPKFIQHLNLKQTQFMLAHEAMHCALGHFARRHHREIKRWDVACDHAVNLILWDDGLQPPPGCLMNPEYHGLVAEEIYPLIPPDPQEETIDSHMYDNDSSTGSQNKPDKGQSSDNKESQDSKGEGGSGQGQEPPPDQRQGDAGGQAAKEREEKGGVPNALSESEKEELGRQWQQRLAAAAQQAAQAGKLSQSIARMVDNLLQPQLPWRMLLARYMKTAARDDYSFQRPSRREGEAILPSLASSMIDILCVIDTSGSIDDEEMREFLSEVDIIKAQLRARVLLHACDDKLDPAGPWLFEAWEPMKLPEQISGGGGTDFRPPFEWLDKEQQRPDLVVYFTDAEGEFPKIEPQTPVIWLVKGKQPVPWGQRIQLN